MSTTYDTTGPDVSTPQVPDGYRADADRIIREINRPRQAGDDSETWDWLPEMDLPGFGQLGDECGDDMIRFCSCCGETVTVGRTCRRSRCPRCSREWVMNAATSVAAKLKATWAYQYQSLEEHPYYHHMVISPPDDWALEGEGTTYDRTLDVVKEIMDEFGMTGVPIYHPYRGSDETREHDDRGEWKKRLFNDRDWQDVRGELRPSPHFHVVGISPHIDVGVTEQVEKETGWVIHRITQQDSPISVGNDWDMARAVAYCLSHAGLYQDDNGDWQSAYHYVTNPLSGIKTRDRTREEMDAIVRSVAPTVLDVDPSKITCNAEVGQDQAATAAVSVAGGASDPYEVGTLDATAGDGDQEGDDADLPGQEDSDPDGSTTCRGRLLPIWDAPAKLEDDDWRQSAPFARTLQETYQEWVDTGGRFVGSSVG